MLSLLAFQMMCFLAMKTQVGLVLLLLFLKTATKMYSLTVVVATSPQSRCQQGHASPEDSREEFFLAFLAFGDCGHPWCSLACKRSPEISASSFTWPSSPCVSVSLCLHLASFKVRVSSQLHTCSYFCFGKLLSGKVTTVSVRSHLMRGRSAAHLSSWLPSRSRGWGLWKLQKFQGLGVSSASGTLCHNMLQALGYLSSDIATVPTFFLLFLLRSQYIANQHSYFLMAVPFLFCLGILRMREKVGDNIRIN